MLNFTTLPPLRGPPPLTQGRLLWATRPSTREPNTEIYEKKTNEKTKYREQAWFYHRGIDDGNGDFRHYCGDDCQFFRTYFRASKEKPTPRGLYASDGRFPQ